jgi:hypothetical protein
MHTPETREWPTAVVVSLSSGRLLCEFSEMRRLAEWLVGHPIWTHQFAHIPFVDELRLSLVAQHPILLTFDAEAVTNENWMVKASEANAMFGATLLLHPMGEPETSAASFTEPLSRIGSKRQKD